MPTLEEKKQWYSNFIAQMQEKGYNMSDPYALGLVQVIPDYSYNDLCNMEDKIFEGKIKEYKDAHNIKDNEGVEIYTDNMKPAFLEVEKSGDDYELVHPFDPNKDDNYAEYIHQNTVKEVSDKQIEYLFAMAQQGRLVVQDKTFDQSQKKMFLVNAVPGKNGEYKSQMIPSENLHRTNKDNIMSEFGISGETFEKFLDRSNTIREVDVATGLSSLGEIDGMKGNKKYTKEDILGYANRITWYSTKRLLCTAGTEFPESVNSKDARKLLNQCAHITSKGSKNLTEAEAAVAKKGKHFFMTQLYTSITGSLNKKANKDIIESNKNKPLDQQKPLKDYKDIIADGVFDTKGNRIKCSSRMDYINKLSFELSRNREVFVNIQNGNKKTVTPFTQSVTFHGVNQTKGETAYLDELDSLKEELLKTDSTFSRDSKAYKDLKESLVGLKDRIKAKQIIMDRDPEKSQYKSTKEIIDAELESITGLAKTYQEAHANKSLSDRQIDRLTVIAKIQFLNDKRKSGEVFPQNFKIKIKDNLAIEHAKDLIKNNKGAFAQAGANYLTDHKKLSELSDAITATESYKSIMKHQDEAFEVFKKHSSKELYDAYSDMLKAENSAPKPKAPQKPSNDMVSSL